jgi:hypothetical protein
LAEIHRVVLLGQSAWLLGFLFPAGGPEGLHAKGLGAALRGSHAFALFRWRGGVCGLGRASTAGFGAFESLDCPVQSVALGDQESDYVFGWHYKVMVAP